MVWKVLQLDDYTTGPDGEHVGESRVVYRVHWECTDTANGYSARSYGAQSLEPFTGGDAFVAWADVTEALALAWLYAKAPSLQAATEARVADNLEEQANPTTGRGVPWTGE
jgi:hypothetical protein